VAFVELNKIVAVVDKEEIQLMVLMTVFLEMEEFEEVALYLDENEPKELN
jgi:hypothetical protein